jgi:glycine oxidase
MSAAPRSKSYDVVVVGAGIVGLACAWRAAGRGLSVLVVDRDAPGAGASGVAAGLLAPVTEADFGEEALLELNLESARMWPAFAAELAERSGIDVGHRESGALVVAADRDDAEELRRLHAFQRSLGLDAGWLSGRDCRRLEPGLSPRVAGAILAPQDGQVDPEAAIRALAVASEAAGAEVVAGLEARAVEPGRVRTSQGSIAAERVLVAAGCWSSALVDLPVRPVKGQILSLRARTRGAPRLAERVVRSPRCYLLDRGDGRVVLGATVEEQGFDATVTAEGTYRLLEAAFEVVPEVMELELVAGRAGLRPGSPDNAPLIGTTADGVLVATGHHRNGVLLAPVTAAAVADLLTGAEPPDALRPFAPDRFATRPLAGRTP